MFLSSLPNGGKNRGSVIGHGSGYGLGVYILISYTYIKTTNDLLTILAFIMPAALGVMGGNHILFPLVKMNSCSGFLETSQCRNGLNRKSSSLERWFHRWLTWVLI